MGVLDASGRGIVDALRVGANPAASLVLNKLNYILAIVAGCLFLIGAILALLNLLRDRYLAHVLLFLFCLERVATYIFRAILYKKQDTTNALVFEILETIGFALLITALYHIWSGTMAKRTEEVRYNEMTGAEDRTKKRGKRNAAWCLVPLASLLAAAAAALFIAGAVLQDRRSSSASQFDRGLKLRKAAVIIYGVLLAVFDVLALMLFFRRGGRRAGTGLLIAALLLSAKAAFMIYAIFRRRDRYYDTEWFWPFLVLTELLALLVLVTPGFVRAAFKPREKTLPVTDRQVADTQYVPTPVQPKPYGPKFSEPAQEPRVHVAPL